MRLRRMTLLAGVLAAIACGRSAFNSAGFSPGTPTLTGTPTPTAAPSRPPPPPFAYQRMIVVSAGTAVPAGYSIPVSFNHAALVSAGKALASGNDVRVLVPSAGNLVEVDRVLDSGSAWLQTNTTLWFRLPPAVAASTTNDSSLLEYGNPAATTPPENPDNVFLFADGFESGTLSNWTAGPPSGVSGLAQLFTVSSNQSHSGTKALLVAPYTACFTPILVANGLSAANVRFDAWWYLPSVQNANIAQGVRIPATGNYLDYESNYVQVQTEGTRNAGQVIAQCTVSDTGNQFAPFLYPPQVQPFAAATWTRVSVAVSGESLEVFSNGAQVMPTPPAAPFSLSGQGTTLGAGSVGFRVCNTGADGWFVDDVTVRPYVSPEPAATLRPETSFAAARR